VERCFVTDMGLCSSLRRMGAGCALVQALLLHYTIRRTWAIGNRQRKVYFPILSGVFTKATACHRSVDSQRRASIAEGECGAKCPTFLYASFDAHRSTCEETNCFRYTQANTSYARHTTKQELRHELLAQYTVRQTVIF
jgi:hypothetical protein